MIISSPGRTTWVWQTWSVECSGRDSNQARVRAKVQQQQQPPRARSLQAAQRARAQKRRARNPARTQATIMRGCFAVSASTTARVSSCSDRTTLKTAPGVWRARTWASTCVPCAGPPGPKRTRRGSARWWRRHTAPCTPRNKHAGHFWPAEELEERDALKGHFLQKVLMLRFNFLIVCFIRNGLCVSLHACVLPRFDFALFLWISFSCVHWSCVFHFSFLFYPLVNKLVHQPLGSLQVQVQPPLNSSLQTSSLFW